MNNKGFAITTILYGTFLLFMMLLLTMRGILSNYKHKMDILVDNTNGARDIVDIYRSGAHFMTIAGRKYYKKNDGVAIIGMVYDNTINCTGPLLVSTDPDAVTYYTSHDSSVFPSVGSVVYLGTTYHYSSDGYWMCSANFPNQSVYEWTKYENMKLRDAAIKLLEDKVKYYVNNE